MDKYNFELSGLTCSACAKLAQKRLSKIEGVETVSVDSNGKTTILSAVSIDKKVVNQALSDTDYKVV